MTAQTSTRPSSTSRRANDCLGDPIIENCVGWEFLEVACLADPTVTDACCNWLVYGQGFYCPGRPFVVGGSERLAPAMGSESWAHSLALDVAALPPRERTAVADAWTECALFEHASVASFARFVFQLLAAGAPPELVTDAQQAMREELEHARAFFGLASAYAGMPIGPGPLRIDGSLSHAEDLATIVAAAASEGCIAETISAMHVAVAATHVRDAVLADLLRDIAEEELRHAELAWKFVAWALHHGPPAVRTAVADAFANATRAIPRPAVLDDSIPSAVYLAQGLLPAEHRDMVTHVALDEIIFPAAMSLLASGKRPNRTTLVSTSTFAFAC